MIGPASAQSPRALPAPPFGALAAIWRRYEGPTWLVALVIYGGWGLITWYHASLPWWLLIGLGSYLVAWHFSLQHETIHAMRHVPLVARYALALPPLGLWLPYPIYRRGHSKHHVNINLTDPLEDTESFYHTRAAWAAMSPFGRLLYRINQTFLGRMVWGPFLRLHKLARTELRRLAARDYRNVPTWIGHAVLLALLFTWISVVCGMAWWQYVLLIAYPAFGLGYIRSFIEHRAAALPKHRVAIIEASWVFGLLFLNNNLHAAHHLRPAIPWYALPGFYRANRDRLLAHNGGFVFRGGYWEIARRWLVRPVFEPVHPTR